MNLKKLESSVMLLARCVGMLALLSTISALEWERTKVEFEAAMTDELMHASFPFVAEDSVTIDMVRTTCGCAVANVFPRSFQAGDTGTVEATFEFGSRRGKQIKSVIVQYTVGLDRTSQQQRLNMIADIPEVIQLTKTVIYWRAEEAPFQPKRIAIIRGVEPATKIVALYSDLAPSFDVKLLDENGGDYQFGSDLFPAFIEAVPRAGVSKASEQVDLGTNHSLGRYQRRKVALLVYEPRD